MIIKNNEIIECSRKYASGKEMCHYCFATIKKFDLDHYVNVKNFDMNIGKTEKFRKAENVIDFGWLKLGKSNVQIKPRLRTPITAYPYFSGSLTIKSESGKYVTTTLDSKDLSQLSRICFCLSTVVKSSNRRYCKKWLNLKNHDSISYKVHELFKSSLSI
jgi:hypothetical protein